MAWEDMTKRERDEFKADMLMVVIVAVGAVVIGALHWLLSA